MYGLNIHDSSSYAMPCPCRYFIILYNSMFVAVCYVDGMEIFLLELRDEVREGDWTSFTALSSQTGHTQQRHKNNLGPCSGEYGFCLGQNTKKSKQIFPEKKLHSPSPNFHIHVYVSDYIFPRSACLFCCRTDPGNINVYKSFTETCMCKLELRPRNSFSGNT